MKPSNILLDEASKKLIKFTLENCIYIFLRKENCIYFNICGHVVAPSKIFWGGFHVFAEIFIITNIY